MGSLFKFWLCAYRILSIVTRLASNSRREEQLRPRIFTPSSCLSCFINRRPHEQVAPWQVFLDVFYVLVWMARDSRGFFYWRVSMLKSLHANFSTRRLANEKTWANKTKTCQGENLLVCAINFDCYSLSRDRGSVGTPVIWLKDGW